MSSDQYRIGDPAHWLYATLCPLCGRRRGWEQRQAADRHLADLVAAGLVMADAVSVEAYQPGDDATCACGDPQ